MDARNNLRGWVIGAAAGFVAIGGLSVDSARGALLYLEWADTPGVDSKTLSVGQSATINIRLDLIAGESWGSADVPLGIGWWLAPDNVPNFEITGFQTDGFVSPSHSYDRSGLPALPMSPEEYRLTTTYDGVTPIDGPTSIVLDQLSIEAISVGHDDIVFGESVSQEIPIVVDKFLFGADGSEWQYRATGIPVSPEEWSDGVGNPGTIPATPREPFRSSDPLELNVVPEPVSGLIFLTSALLGFKPRRSR